MNKTNKKQHLIYKRDIKLCLQTEECTQLQQTVTEMNIVLHQWSLEVNLRGVYRCKVTKHQRCQLGGSCHARKKHRSEKKRSKIVELHLNYR